jgi:hypothetical protein
MVNPLAGRHRAPPTAAAASDPSRGAVHYGPGMAEVIIIEVDCDATLYAKVNEILSLDPNTGAGNWPKGLLTHLGGGGDGTVVVVEVWESRADQESWMASTLGPALGQAGVAQPKRMEWLSLLGRVNL